MCNKLATIGQSDYESELVRADARANAGPKKLNLHLARDRGNLSMLARNGDSEAQEAQPLFGNKGVPRSPHWHFG